MTEDMPGYGDPLDDFGGDVHVGVGEDEVDPNLDILSASDVVGGHQCQKGEEDIKETVTSSSNYVTLAMFQLVRKQHDEEVACLKSSFDLHMEERRENEKRLKTCVETLMMEVVRLEERIEELDKRTKVKVPPSPPPPSNQKRRHPRPQRNSDIKIGSDSRGDTQPEDLLQVKIENVVGANFQDSGSNDLYMTEGHQEEDPLSGLGPEPGTLNPPGGNVGVGGTIHGKADGVGNFLPFLCHCGLEFDSEAFLSDHILEEEQEEQMYQAGEPADEANFAYDPLQFHTDWSTPQFQIGSSVNGTPNNSFFTSPAPRTPPHSRKGAVYRKKYVTLPKTGRKNQGGKAKAAATTSSSGFRSKPKKKGRKYYRDKDKYKGLGTTHEVNPYNPLQCICGLEYRDKGKVVAHVTYYNVTKPKMRALYCPFCGNKFNYVSQLDAHIASAHNGGMEKV